MSQLPILIFTALELEARALVRALGLKRVSKVAHCWVSPEVVLQVIGIRSVHVPASLPRARAVILGGLAGALDPALQVGDVVVDATSRPLPAQGILPWARIGPIYTAATVISTAAQKAELFAATGALAVEMENSLLRGQIEANVEHRHLPFLHVRAISDGAADTVDPILMEVIDSLGRPKPWALAAALLRHPTLVPHLRRVGLNSARGGVALARAVQGLLRHWP